MSCRCVPIHLGVADALADAERRRVDAVDAGFDRRKAIDEPHAAVAVAMPIHLHVLFLDDLLLDEFHQRLNAVRCRMSDGIGETEPRRTAVDRRAVQRLQRLGSGAGRVFGHVHHREAVLHRVRHGLGAGLHDAVDSPILGILTDRGGADERGGLDLDPDFVRDAHDGLDIRDHRAGGAIGEDGQLRVPDFPGERAHLLHDARSRPRQPDVRGHDAQVGHQVQETLFVVERGIGDGGRLQAVPQRLIVQVHPRPRPVERRGAVCPVPVVDQIALLHGTSVTRVPVQVKRRLPDSEGAP